MQEPQNPPPEHFGKFVFNREDEKVDDKDFRVWLENTKEDLGKYFMVDSNRESVIESMLDKFVGRLINGMADHPRDHRHRLWNEVQQDGITIMNILLKNIESLLLQVLKNYEAFLLKEYFEVLCNNLQFPQKTKRANILTLRATYQALVDLCEDPKVKNELRSYIEDQRGSGNSVLEILRRNLKFQDEEKELTEKLLEALDLLDRFQARNEESELEATQLAYQRVIKHQKDSCKGVKRKATLKNIGRTLKRLQSSHNAVKKKREECSKKAWN